MFKVITKYPIAYESRDHIVPGATAIDNFTDKIFVKKIQQYFYPHKFNFLDLGCAGGKLVEDIHNNGNPSIGLEGSDYSLKNKRASWSNIPNNLFTCDIGKQFQILYDGKYILFDVITCWEVLEHLSKKELYILFDNIRRHLSPSGFFAVSISSSKEYSHITVENQDWWLSLIKDNSFEPNHILHQYIYPDFVRGPIQKEDRGRPYQGFNLVLTRIN